MKIDKVQPHLTFKVWGGEKLWQYKSPKNQGEVQPEEPLGETWEVSRHSDGTSLTSEGEKLSELYSEAELPYLIKFIDTGANLSIQVHPDDDYASVHENDSGKTECWLIMDSQPGAGIYLGLKSGVDKEKLKAAIDKGESVNELLNFYEVKAGDFFFVPAGSIHAIGEGVTLAEIQQSSGITYRVWDWNRMGTDGKPRELHIQKALDVINFDSKLNTKEYFKYIPESFKHPEIRLVEHDDFTVTFFSAKETELEIDLDKRVNSLVVLEGEIECLGQTFSKYDCGILPPNDGKVCVRIDSEAKFLFVK